MNNPARIPTMLLAIAVLLLLSACSTGGGSRGRVSDRAAQAEQEEDPGRGTGSTRTKEDHKDQADEDDEEDEGSFLVNFLVGLFSSGDDDDYYEPQPAPQHTGPYPASSPHDWEFAGQPDSNKGQQETNATDDGPTELSHQALTVWLARANPAGDAISRVSSISALYTASSDPGFRGHFGFYYGEGRKGSQAVVQDGIGEIWEYGVDLGARSYLQPNENLSGLYVLFGIRGGAMRWNYAWTESGFDNVSSDGVLIFTPYLGLGTSVFQAGPVQLGANLSWGPRIMLDETFEKYENDLFPSVGELRFNLETSFFF